MLVARTVTFNETRQLDSSDQSSQLRGNQLIPDECFTRDVGTREENPLESNHITDIQSWMQLRKAIGVTLHPQLRATCLFLFAGSLGGTWWVAMSVVDRASGGS